MVKLWVFKPDNQRDDLFDTFHGVVVVAAEVDGEVKWCEHPGVRLDEWNKVRSLPGLYTLYGCDSVQTELFPIPSSASVSLSLADLLIWTRITVKGDEWNVPDFIDLEEPNVATTSGFIEHLIRASLLLSFCGFAISIVWLFWFISNPSIISSELGIWALFGSAALVATSFFLSAAKHYTISP